MARGYARIENRDYLEKTPGITDIVEANGRLEFQYDPANIPTDSPEGVLFQLDKAAF